MNLKRIAALASMSAMIFSAAPAMAASGTVTVKWNTQKSAAIALYTDPTASQTGNAAPAANDIFYASSPAASTSSNCNGSQAASKDGATNGPWAANTINFGNVTPDGVNYTNCLEINAIEAYITTNDGAGVQTQAAITGTPVGYGAAAAGSQICILGDGWTAGGAQVAATAFALSARVAPVAMTSTTACSTGFLLTGANTTLANSNLAATQDLNQDFQLNLAPNSTVGSVSATLTYTVTPN